MFIIKLFYVILQWRNRGVKVSKITGTWTTRHLIQASNKLEQLERLRSEIPPAAQLLPILVIHTKTRQSQMYKFKKKLPKIQVAW